MSYLKILNKIVKQLKKAKLQLKKYIFFIKLLVKYLSHIILANGIACI